MEENIETYEKLVSGNKPVESDNEISLGEAFEKLDELLKQLDERDIPLEKAFTLYQQGVELLKKCNEKIDMVEKKVMVLNGDGEFDEFR